MAIQERSTYLKLRDNDPKALGASRIQAGTVVCDDPALTEGVQFQVDYETGTVRRLIDLGPDYDRKLIGFSFEYDDGSDQPKPPSLEEQIANLQAAVLELSLRV